MLVNLGADALVLEDLPKVFGFQESHVEVLRLGLHILRKDDIREEFLCRLSCLK